MEIRKGASGLEMVEQPCHYWGTSQLVFDAMAITEFDAAKTPTNTHLLAYNGKSFDSQQAEAMALGYDPELPPRV